jgi:hypothetical protein
VAVQVPSPSSTISISDSGHPILPDVTAFKFAAHPAPATMLTRNAIRTIIVATISEPRAAAKADG